MIACCTFDADLLGPTFESHPDLSVVSIRDRDASLSELVAEFDISQQAASERLRRGATAERTLFQGAKLVAGHLYARPLPSGK